MADRKVPKKHLCEKMQKQLKSFFSIFMLSPSASENLRGHTGLGPSIRNTSWQLDTRTCHARILKFRMWHVHGKQANPYFQFPLPVLPFRSYALFGLCYFI